MKLLLATQKATGKGGPEAQRKGRFGVYQPGRGQAEQPRTGQHGCHLPAMDAAVVEILKYFHTDWQTVAAECSAAPPLPRMPQTSLPSNNAPSTLLPSRGCSCSITWCLYSLVGKYFGCGPEKRPTYWWPAFLSLSCHSCALAPWPPHHIDLVPKRAHFRSRSRLITHPHSPWGRGRPWAGLTQRQVWREGPT